MEQTLLIKTINCPQCQGIVYEHPDYVTWCEKCNWNVLPEGNMQPSSLFDKLYLKAGKKQSEGLLNSMIRNGSLPPKISFRKILFLAFCTFIHIISLILCLSGIYLIIAEFPHVLPMIIGSFLLLLAWTTRPRGYRLDTKPLSREQFPAAYQIVDEIASITGAQKVHGIIIDGRFNASIAQTGLRKKQIIYLGLPLLSILEKQEFTSLVAHEIAHGMNGDLNRSFFVSSTISSLITWYQMIKPTKLFDTDVNSFLIALGLLPVNIFLLLVSRLIYLSLYLICHLNWFDSQRAEYLADRYAAEITGKDGLLSFLNKLHLQSLFDFCIQKTANDPGVNSLFDELQNRVKRIPDKELERIKRVYSMSDSRLDATHPPTANRILYIDTLKISAPKYELTDELYNRFRNEITPLKPVMELKILDEYKVNVLGW